MNIHPVSPTTDSDLLHEAFRSFDDAAVTLQQSYQTLTSRLEQLDLELADRNEALGRLPNPPHPDVPESACQ